MKKTFFLLYGVVAYVIFFATFCYAIGFVNRLYVPPKSTLGNALLINVALLLLFVLQHSIMARPAFKRWWTKFIPGPIERSTYVLLSSLCLLALFHFWKPVGGIVWFVESTSLQLLLVALCILGFGIVLISTFFINHFELFGLRQVWLHFRNKKYSQVPFRTPYFYKYVRHPVYLGFMIAFWSTPLMTATHLFFAIITSVCMLTAIRFEENDLIKQFGAKYWEYKRSAPMLLPFSRFLVSKKAAIEN